MLDHILILNKLKETKAWIVLQIIQSKKESLMTMKSLIKTIHRNLNMFQNSLAHLEKFQK